MCNCGGSAPVNPSTFYASPKSLPKTNAIIPRELTPVKTTIINSKKEGDICRKCGRPVKKIKHLDLRNSEIIERWACANHTCVLYNQ